MIYERIANKRLNFTIYNSSLPFLIPTRHFNKYSIINQMNANYEEIVPEDIRDSVFKQLKKVNKNNICIDCEKKNPTWASIHLGVHLCIDCAGKHRQYGVMYSFVKSTNLDKWNRKQLLFMQKGGNQRAMEYLTKCGVIGESHKHIDYKSPIVQRYKGIITGQVESQITGKPSISNSSTKQSTSKVEKVQESSKNELNVPKEIPTAQTVQGEQKGKKKNKKKVGKKINLDDFDNLVLDDGVPTQQKQKIIKAYESNIKTQLEAPTKSGQNQQQDQPDNIKIQQIQKPVIEPPKQMSQQQTKQKLEELKSKQNVKSISSDQFKDNSISNDELKQNLNKFHGSQSISSSAFFGNQQSAPNSTQNAVEKLKDFVSQTSGKLYGKLSSYWSKK